MKWMISAALLAFSLSGCGKEKDEPRYVRASAGCTCAERKDGSPCKCNHCSGEKGSKCYCGDGGCGCGATMTKCGCGHCLGEADDPKCACKK